ncbi:MAG: glycosyltransferase family 2 protein [Acidobacteriota bacterium]
MKLSAVIIAFNEEDKIADAIRSVSWADEVVVVDSESTDRTREIAAELRSKIVVNPWPGFSQQKQLGVDLAENDWILSVDADERISDELKTEILHLKEGGDGYRIPRLTLYMGRPIRHGGWYPDRQLRLFDRRKGRWNGRLVHESVAMDSGSVVEELRGDILHFSIDGPEHHHRMIGERYAPLAARHMLESGRRTTKFGVTMAAPIAFLRTYFVRLGFLDGFPGFCIARFAAHHAFLKYALLLELQNGKSEEK